GRYVVLLPCAREVGVSRRIDDAREKERLKGLAKQSVPPGFGIIIRTAAAGIDEETLRGEIDELLSLWQEIMDLAAKMPTPSLLYRDTGLLGRVLRDELDERVSRIIVDDPDHYEQVLDYVAKYANQTHPTVELYNKNIPIFEYFDIEREISAILERKLWLPSGGFLIIDQAEAMTVI